MHIYLIISRPRRRISGNSHPDEFKVTNCFSIITLMIIRENKIKKRHILERFWGFKMSVEGGSDRQHWNWFSYNSCRRFSSQKRKILPDIYLFHRLPCFLFHLWILAAVETILYIVKTKYFAKVTNSCRHFEAKNCKQTYQFSVNCTFV